MPNIVTVPAVGAFDPTDIEITDNIDDAFLIRDSSGNEWFKIDTRSGTGEDCINMAYTSGQRVLIGKPASSAQGPFSPFQVINQNNDSYAVRIYGDTGYQVDNQLAWGRDSQKPVWIHPLGGRFDSTSSSGSFDFRNSSALAMLTMDDDTNATYVIDYDAAAENKFVVGTNRTVSSGNLLQVSSRNAGLGNIEGIFFAGPSTSQVWVNGPSVFRIQGATFIHNTQSGRDFTVNAGDGSFVVENSSNTTVTLDDGNNAVFKVQDDAGTPTNLLKIDTTGTNDIEMNAGTYDFKDPNGNTVIKFDASNSFRFGTDSAGGVGAYRGVGDELRIDLIRSGGAKIINKMRARGGGDGDSFRVNSNTETNLEIDQDSNATFTLDSSSTCNFKVVDDAGSPTTYIDVERGSTEKVKIPVVALTTIRADGGTFVAGVSNTTGISLNTYPLNYANTLLTFDQTADGTTSAQGIKTGLTVVYSSSASGAATSSGITLQLGAGVPGDGTTSPQYLVMHNQNATHSAKFILDGSGFYSGHEVATSGSDAADLIGSGFTLAAGKFAVFSIIACRVTNTGDHYFYAVSLHTKT